MQLDLRKLGTFSPLRYPGGKAVLARFLAEVIKEKRLHRLKYVEPYAGGAGAGLALLLHEKVERIVINDLDPAVYAFWNAIVEENDWFIKKICSVPLTVMEWRKQREIYRNPDSHPNRKLGFAFFYLNRTNRSGILDGCPIGGLQQDGPWKIDARFNRSTLKERVKNIGEYSGRITVECKDGAKLARQYLKRGDCLVYADPPYFEKGSALYLNHFCDSDHRALADCLNEYADGNWLLTYDNVHEVRDLYAKRKMAAFSLRYSAHTARLGSEVLVASDPLSSIALR